MLRVLLLLEDYGELMFLQTLLKKIGFDVDGIQNPKALADHLLKINPDVLILTAFGKRVRGFEMASQIKRRAGLPKILLIRAPGAPPLDDPGIYAWLDSPVGAQQVLDQLADLASLNKQVLQEKLQKMRQQEAEEKARTLRPETGEQPTMEKAHGESGNFSQAEASTEATPARSAEPAAADGESAAVQEQRVDPLGGSLVSATDRQERYKNFLKSASAPTSHGYAVKQVQDQIKALRREESAEDLEDLERERRAFVEQLFKK